MGDGRAGKGRGMLRIASKGDGRPWVGLSMQAGYPIQ
jgi:hypothetical protein